MALQAFAWFAQ